jgi:RNA polymerase sigma factor (sigma-70 family)
MFCKKCGAELVEEGRFCSRCGAPVAGPKTPQSDAELERLAAQGDRNAFAELYNRHSSRVYDFLLRMVGDPDEASDLMQETFLRAMRALSPEEKEAAFSTWVLTIARNLALKRLERRKRTVALAEREGDEEAPVFDQVDPDRLAQPEAAAEAGEMSGLVWEAAVALDPKQYSLLDLHVRQGLDSAEIAQVLGVSKGNAYTMISRLKDTFESAVASLFMLRVGRRDCPELNRLLEEQSVTALSPTVRKLVESHVADCEGCQERRRRLVSPANILGAFAVVPLPLVLKQRVAEALVASWAQAGTQAAAAGPKAFLAQPAAKLASLPMAWKAGLIAGALTVAVGGGLGGWVGVTGGLPGAGGNETPKAAIPVVVGFSPTPTPSAVATPAPSPSRTITRSPTATATPKPSPTAAVSSPVLPDLTVAGIFWTPNQPQEGDPVVFSFSVNNQGNAQASPFACALLIDGVQVDTSAGHSLAAGESATIQFSLQWASTPGSHTVTVEADWGSEVEEASNDNNGMAETVTVSPKPIPTDTATTAPTLVPTPAPSPTPSATPMLSPTATPEPLAHYDGECFSFDYPSDWHLVEGHCADPHPCHVESVTLGKLDAPDNCPTGDMEAGDVQMTIWAYGSFPSAHCELLDSDSSSQVGARIDGLNTTVGFASYRQPAVTLACTAVNKGETVLGITAASSEPNPDWTAFWDLLNSLKLQDCAPQCWCENEGFCREPH